MLVSKRIYVMQRLVLMILFLSFYSCVPGSNSTGTATGLAIGGLVGAGVGAIIDEKMQVELKELNADDISKIEFKDREFIEAEITEREKIDSLINQLKLSSVTEANAEEYNRTVELVFHNGNLVRINVSESHLKVGNRYYSINKELYERINEYF